MRRTLAVRGLKLGTAVKGDPQFQTASAAPTSDRFSGKQDPAICILLETGDPGATGLSNPCSKGDSYIGQRKLWEENEGVEG